MCSTILCTAITLGLTLATVRSRAVRQEHEKLNSNLRVAWQLIHERGEVRLIDGRLLAGSTVLDGDTALVDQVRDLVGGVATIFRGATRVATNVKTAEGARATGTVLSFGPAYDAVVRKHTRYDGIADILGHPYITVYDPIISSSGEEIGILFVGERLAKFDDASRTTRNQILLGGAAAVILVGLGFTVLATRMFRPLRGLILTLQHLASNETAIDVPGLERGDEIGAIARAVMVFKESVIRLGVREAELRHTSARFEVALSNMSQGLCLYDGAGILEVSNQQFCTLYEIDRDQIHPGLSFREVLGLSRLLKNLVPAEFETFVADREAFFRKREAGCMVVKLGPGRAISVTHRPLANDGWIATYEDVTARQAADAKIAHMARHDALTGLPNRFTLCEQVDQALTASGRGVQSAVLCLDLDHFKHVNDTLGHPIGDGLLRSMSDRLLACVREGDMVARLGGDEFAIIQHGIERPEDAKLLAERIVATMQVPFAIDGHHIRVGVSIGIAIVADDGRDVASLLKHADIALYRAKADERGMYCFFEPEMDARLQRRRQLEIDLREALANAEFELFYQPLVALQTDEVCGFEALLRWRHPKRGMVSPAEFIPLAEEIGLIVPLGEWVIRRACVEAADWPPDIKVAVNLSPIQFRSKNLVPTVASSLADSGLAAGRLELEVTETLLMENDERTVAMLHQLRSLGTRISMDDFGTGYSSLSYLRSFPFDKIKIDQSFIRDVSRREDALHIVRAIQGLCAGLGITTTAEGVETEEVLAKLRAEGCTEVQGYLFSKPRPAHDVPLMIEQVRERCCGPAHDRLREQIEAVS